MGYAPHATANISDALEAAKRMASVDLLLCDVRLPDGDGSRLAELLRRSNPATKVVLMSGADFPHVDVDACVRKPVEFDALMNVLASALSGSDSSG
jgi:CheY-like chemotaxis protein